jgi:hypothetical protein
MPTLDEVLEKKMPSEADIFEEEVTIQEPEEETGGFSIDFSWLRTPTGEGSIEEYINHPLNFNRSEGMAKVLRGFTGLVGDLKLAVIDIALGVLQMWRGRNVN